MAQIDQLLGSIVRFGATGALLSSDEKVMLSFPGGPRYASQTTPHASLVKLVEEILPAGIEVNASGPTVFSYKNGGPPVRIRVEAGPDCWKVAVETLPALSAAAAAPVSAAVAAAPASSSPPAEPAAPAVTGNARPRFADIPVTAAIDRLLLRMLEMGASDLHLATDCPPRVRVHGKMTVLPGAEPTPEHVLMEQLLEITPERNRAEFEARNDTDFGHTIPGASRFRANLFRDRRGPGGVFRAIPFEILKPERLGLPPQVLDLCQLTKGLVLVTGPTGSGKSTTLASLIDHINETRTDHIITIEDPLEFVHENKKCLINQRQVGEHTSSFKDALRAALREDPDIVLVGEMRDLETVAIAIETAETGHLVFGTLHTSSAPSTVDRIIDQFPADRQGQIRVMLSESLKAVISQALCKKIGGGRVPVLEVLISTPSVANLIREAKVFQIPSIMQTGKKYGMCLMNESYTDVVRKKIVDPQEADAKALDKAGLLNMFKKNNIDTSWAPTDKDAPAGA
jgi:twitching motility protein PilT